MTAPTLTGMKLPTLSEYIDKRKGREITLDKCILYDDITNFNKFCRTPLELGQFVACGKDGKPLEEPKLTDYVFEDHPELVGNPKEFDRESYNKAEIEYQKAQESVLFEGWEYGYGKLNMDNRYNLDFRKMPEGKFFFIAPDLEKLKTIEDLIDGGIELIPTDSTRKSLNL